MAPLWLQGAAKTSTGADHYDVLVVLHLDLLASDVLVRWLGARKASVILGLTCRMLFGFPMVEVVPLDNTTLTSGSVSPRHSLKDLRDLYTESAASTGPSFTWR